MSPKPLVQVWRTESAQWTYDCGRCFRRGWDPTWEAAYARARNHAGMHVGVGFAPQHTKS